MKKLISIAAALLLLLSLTACGGESGSDISAASGSASQEVPTSALFIGRVTDASMHQMTVEDENGNSACFLLTDDTVYSFLAGDGLLNDMNVSVSFSGELSPEAGNCTALIVTELEAAAAETHTFTGLVMDASMNQMTVEDENGNSACFLLTDDTVYSFSDGEGLLNGMRVSVSFSGELSADCTALTVTEVNTAMAETHTFTGIVTDASMNNISVLGEDDDLQLNFSLNDQVVYNVTDGVGVDMTVMITYTGELPNNSDAEYTVVRIDEIEPAPLTTQSYSGKVIDASMNNLLVENDAGRQVDFNLNDDVVYVLHDGDGITVNMYVIVDYTGTIVDGSAAGCTVVSITERT